MFVGSRSVWAAEQGPFDGDAPVFRVLANLAPQVSWSTKACG